MLIIDFLGLPQKLLQMQKTFIRILPILILAFFWSCQTTTLNYPESPEILGLASPALLKPNETIIYTEDYFTNPNLIDSINLPMFISGKLSTSKLEILIESVAENAPQLMADENLDKWVSIFHPSKKTKRN